ncbi:uncharacterized protein TNIN_376761 [Trichonephila inaurata madagascariensis]|uniref:Uncharacterized protein n=1 Tax=Trichonephila inaurata madagascariensis TaxID=2747483 RepID=A0A8X6YMC5_9ARAC|nr:uncharacterized protein TNIN_376761 [Trichonephila inaurata madagascariensis]
MSLVTAANSFLIHSRISTKSRGDGEAKTFFHRVGTECTFFFPRYPQPPHSHNDVRRYLKEYLPQHWIGQSGRDVKVSPDMTLCDIFLWGFMKDKVFVPPLPLDLVELRGWIRNEFAVVTREMSVRVWT